MADSNSYHERDWNTVHHSHHEERARASAEMKRVAKGGKKVSEAYGQAKAAFDRHHAAACLAALKTPHAIVQDYAERLSREFPVDVEDL